MKQPGWRASTAETINYVIQGQILKDLGHAPLIELGKDTLQLHINKLAERYSYDVVQKVKVLLKSILAEAVELDYLVKNPAGKLQNPLKRPQTKPFLTMEQIQAGVYVGDVRANDGAFARVILTVDFTLVEGITR